jgi:hypothetical protein
MEDSSGQGVSLFAAEGSTVSLWVLSAASVRRSNTLGSLGC